MMGAKRKSVYFSKETVQTLEAIKELEPNKSDSEIVQEALELSKKYKVIKEYRNIDFEKWSVDDLRDLNKSSLSVTGEILEARDHIKKVIKEKTKISKEKMRATMRSILSYWIFANEKLEEITSKPVFDKSEVEFLKELIKNIEKEDCSDLEYESQTLIFNKLITGGFMERMPEGELRDKIFEEYEKTDLAKKLKKAVDIHFK